MSGLPCFLACRAAQIIPRKGGKHCENAFFGTLTKQFAAFEQPVRWRGQGDNETAVARLRRRVVD
ncbi:hypothetical protein PE067_02165 [Paracoccus sp. DMF-8]|uniref:hypothetical protein n=1 Tax=Paracoccus sp. DMF-8 TaxID=3019445 RepID=UPI0023E7D52B|nr:hypothetical protein [Paracoccus sp. DMF-8]MDF3605070.1 hypothetical protein [Paracoccus sp. DMF-8]